jgi:hypothetical protein
MLDWPDPYYPLSRVRPTRHRGRPDRLRPSSAPAPVMPFWRGAKAEAPRAAEAAEAEAVLEGGRLGGGGRGREEEQDGWCDTLKFHH